MFVEMKSANVVSAVAFRVLCPVSFFFMRFCDVEVERVLDYV